jgi:hypothetical protein
VRNVPWKAVALAAFLCVLGALLLLAGTVVEVSAGKNGTRKCIIIIIIPRVSVCSPPQPPDVLRGNHNRSRHHTDVPNAPPPPQA